MVCLQFRSLFRKVVSWCSASLRLALSIQYLSRRIDMCFYSAPITRAIASVSFAYFRVSAASCLRPAAVIL